MTKIEKYAAQSKLITDATLEAIRVEPNLWVFSLSLVPRKPVFTGDFSLTKQHVGHGFNQQGFVDDKNFELLKAGKKYKLLDYCVMSLEMQEEFRLHGWGGVMSKHEDKNDLYFGNQFDAMKKQGKINLDTIVKLGSDSHMIFDRHGEPLPVAIYFDYIQANVSNGSYDLNKLASHLLKRKDVVVHSTSGFRSEPDFDTPATSVEEAIAEVPYYNRSRGCSKTVYFTWQPSKKDYNKMWTQCVEDGGKYPSTVMHRSIFKLDLLGLRKAKAALFEDFYNSNKYENSDDDDDY